MAALPPLQAEVTDLVTAQMCQESGHSCPACPIDVRSLMAAAHNAHGAVIAAMEGHGGWDRARRKLGYLKESLDRFRPTMDAHGAALEEWRRP